MSLLREMGLSEDPYDKPAGEPIWLVGPGAAPQVIDVMPYSAPSYPGPVEEARSEIVQIVDEVASAPAALVHWLSPTAAADPERSLTPQAKPALKRTTSSGMQPLSFTLPQYGGRRSIAPASNLPLYLAAGAALLGVLYFATRK